MKWLHTHRRAISLSSLAVIVGMVLLIVFVDPETTPEPAEEEVWIPGRGPTGTTIVVSPTDTLLPPIEHPPPPPPKPPPPAPAPRPEPPPQPDTSNSAACQTERQRFNDWMAAMGDLMGEIEFYMVVGDWDAVQLNYWAAGNLIADELPRRASFVSAACTGARPEMNRKVERVQRDWSRVVATCRRELEPLGFVC